MFTAVISTNPINGHDKVSKARLHAGSQFRGVLWVLFPKVNVMFRQQRHELASRASVKAIMAHSVFNTKADRFKAIDAWLGIILKQLALGRCYVLVRRIGLKDLGNLAPSLFTLLDSLVGCL